MPRQTNTSNPEPALLTAQVWAAGNGPLLVPLAGLLASDPELQDALLSPAEWQTRLDDYNASARP